LGASLKPSVFAVAARTILAEYQPASPPLCTPFNSTCPSAEFSVASETQLPPPSDTDDEIRKARTICALRQCRISRIADFKYDSVGVPFFRSVRDPDAYEQCFALTFHYFQ
jgi:hypothetical protein